VKQDTFLKPENKQTICIPKPPIDRLFICPTGGKLPRKGGAANHLGGVGTSFREPERSREQGTTLTGIDKRGSVGSLADSISPEKEAGGGFFDDDGK